MMHVELSGLRDAQRIRAALGVWPDAGPAWRLHLAGAGPDAGLSGTAWSAGDILVLPCAGEGLRDRYEPLLKANAWLLASDSAGTVLHGRDAVFGLDGVPDKEWLAALLAFLDCGFAPPDALVLALAWRAGDEACAEPWPHELSRFPRVRSPLTEISSRSSAVADAVAVRFPPFPSCPSVLGLYPVVPDAAWVEKLIDLGVETIQLRIKSLPEAQLRGQIERAAACARAAGARLFINDHWRLAIDAKAYGVHLGQEDLQGAESDAIAAIAEAGLRLGVSTHGYYEILLALAVAPSYLAIGSIFPTSTKLVSSVPQGLRRLSLYQRLLEGIVPTVAIGGIDANRLPDVLGTGVGSAALVSAVTQAVDVAAAVAQLEAIFQRFQRAGTVG